MEFNFTYKDPFKTLSMRSPKDRMRQMIIQEIFRYAK